ncbi:MAG: HAD family hydrolase [Lentisphaeria bacterium]|nr:HAD family hydrolase [Lentisphaeria bacterium]
MEQKPIIFAIDFDGTIVENEFPKIGKLKPEVERFIRVLRAYGDKWILYTMREGESLQLALDFIAIHDLLPDAANENLPEMCELYGNNPRKIFAHVYIDDHNAGGLRLAWATADQKCNK